MAIYPREVLITDTKAVLAPTIELLRAASVTVHTLPEGSDALAAATAAKDVPVVIIGMLPFGKEPIRKLSTTGLLIRAGVGYEVIDLDAATAAGIWVANVPDFCIEEVADHTILLLLSALRRLPDAMSLWQTENSWHVTAQLPTVHRVKGKRLGLVGVGRIGQLVAARASSFGMEVVAHDPYMSAAAHSEAGVTSVDLDELFETSDVVSLHCPLTLENHHLVNAERLAAAKPGLILVNTSRGGLVDLKALDDAVVSGSVSYAALDVLEDEPNPDLSNPLLHRTNVLVTSHTAWYSVDAMRELAENTAAEALRYLGGDRPRNLLNPGARSHGADA